MLTKSYSIKLFENDEQVTEKWLNQRVGSYYDHHKFLPRTAKTKDGQRIDQPYTSTKAPNIVNGLSSSHSHNSRLIKSNMNSIRQRPHTESDKKANENKQQKILFKNSYGRVQLFEKQIRNNSDIGPGEYDARIRRSESFGYICRKADPAQSTIKSTNIFTRTIGPHSYDPERGRSLLSNFKRGQGCTFSSQKLGRCLMSKSSSRNDKGRIRKAQLLKRRLGPGCYDVEKARIKASSLYSNANKLFTISRTDRTPLEGFQNKKSPGPGHYNWSKYYDSKNYTKGFDRKKPIIEYKFVYGHPS